MKARILVSLYFLLWIGIAVVAFHYAKQLEFSSLSAVIFAFLLFSFGNSSIVYFFCNHRLKQEGKPSVGYIKSVFLPKKTHETVAIPRPIKIILGAIVFLGGAGFLGVVFLVTRDVYYTSSVDLFVKLLFLLTLIVVGATFSYIGYRLLVIKDDERIFRRVRSK
jgi:hypothetical protein